MGSKIEVVCQFRYACPFNWHFRYQHAVDDHNNLCHGLPSVEDSWTTQQWEIQVFLFVLAISEVNAFLALRYFTFAKGTIPGCPTLIDSVGNWHGNSSGTAGLCRRSRLQEWRVCRQEGSQGTQKGFPDFN